MIKIKKLIFVIIRRNSEKKRRKKEEEEDAGRKESEGEKKKEKQKKIESSDFQGSWIGRSSARPPGERQERSPCGHCEWYDDSVMKNRETGPTWFYQSLLFFIFVWFSFFVFRLFSLSLERGSRRKRGNKIRKSLRQRPFFRFAAPRASSREPFIFFPSKKREKKKERASLKSAR